MKCLVVIAHPLENSLCKHLASETIKKLESNGHNVQVKDLYNEGFGPQLLEQERQTYYQGAFDTAKVVADIEELKTASKLVLVFPTWWFGFPAILKGWFDRVWAPGHAYDHADDLGAIQPRLKNLQEVRVITTLGSPWWVDYLVMWRPVYRILRFAILGTCAKKCKFKMVSLYKSEKVSEERLSAFVQKIKKVL